MLDSGAPAYLWSEAVKTAAYLHQRTPTESLQGRSPYEVLYGQAPQLMHLRRFGCLAYCHIPKEQRTGNKFSDRSRPVLMCGYVHRSVTIWKLYDPSQRRIIEASNVIFVEDRNAHPLYGKAEPQTETTVEPDVLAEAVTQSSTCLNHEDDDPYEKDLAEGPAYDSDTQNEWGQDQQPAFMSSSVEQANVVHTDLENHSTSSTTTSHKAACEIKRALRIEENRAYMAEALHLGGEKYNEMLEQLLPNVWEMPTGDPLTLKDALASPYASHWLRAIDVEYYSLMDCHTYDIMPANYAVLPDGPKPIACRWVFKTKRNKDGTVKFKARLVVKGYLQRHGIDFDDTYAPVARLTTLRVLLSLAATHGWLVTHMDVVAAFLNPKIDRETYIMLPHGTPGGLANRIAKLQKALYGLRQSPRLWHIEINTFLQSLGLQVSTNDPGLYIGARVIVILYVDDILLFDIAGGAAAIRTALTKRFRMTDLGKASRFLGLEITQCPTNGITVGQTEYITSMLKRYRMTNATTVSMPMDPTTHLFSYSVDDKNADADRINQYQSIVGSLMYAALGTRPDISHSVAILSKYSAAPLSMHVTAALRVLRYLKKTATLVLHYPAGKPSRLTAYMDAHSLVAYTDSDWAGCSDTRKSISGGICFLGGGPVSWSAKSQTIVALSTLEAEYVAASDITREVIWLRRLLKEVNPADIKSDTQPPTTVRCDNQGAIASITSGIVRSKTRHIAVKYHHSHDEQEKGTVRFEYIDSASNLADLFTKALPGTTHDRLLKGVGLRPALSKE